MPISPKPNGCLPNTVSNRDARLPESLRRRAANKPSLPAGASPVSGRAEHPMPDQLLGYLVIFPVLITIASLIKNERRLKRWLLKHPRRRRKVLRQPVLT